MFRVEYPFTKQLLKQKVDCFFVTFCLQPPEGFKETKEFGRQHGQKVYEKGNKYYSKDVDSHNGGAWKVFEKNGKKLKRIGTADKDLNIFKQ